MGTAIGRIKIPSENVVVMEYEGQSASAAAKASAEKNGHLFSTLVNLIRRYGLKHRMGKPAVFLET